MVTVDIKGAIQSFETVTSVTSDATTGTITFKDEQGVETVLNVNQLVQLHETLTVLDYKATTGMLTYQDEKGDVVTVDIKGAIQSFETVTSVTSDTTTGTIIFKNEKGVETVLNVNQLVQLDETLTVLGYNATTGILTYQDEKGDVVTVDIKGAVQSYETLTVLGYSETTGLLTYQDEEGGTTTVNLKTAIKANETVTKLVRNQDGTMTYYNEKEIDAEGEPIANTGTTFAIPVTKTYELTNKITTDNSAFYASEWTIEQMIRNWDYPDYFSTTGEEPQVVLRSFFNTDGNQEGSKYMNFDFFVKCNTHTMGDVSPIGKIEAELQVEIYINNVLIKAFFPLRYTFGRAEGYDGFDVKHYGGIVTYANNLNLARTNNTLEIRIAPIRSTFKNNIGVNNGSFAVGAKAFSIEILDVAFHIFEKL